MIKTLKFQVYTGTSLFDRNFYSESEAKEYIEFLKKQIPDLNKDLVEEAKITTIYLVKIYTEFENLDKIEIHGN